MNAITARRGGMPAATLLLSALVVGLVSLSCSTAPKTPDAVYDTENKAAQYSKLGDGFMATGQYDAAEKYYRDALQADSSVDNLLGVSVSHASLGHVYLAVGRNDEARTEFTSALDYARMARSGSALSMATSGLGEVTYAAGSKEDALALFEQAVALAGKDGKSLAIALHDAGVAKAALGRTAEAMGDLQRAESTNLGLKRWTELAANRYVMASLLVAQNRPNDALAMALSALDADKRAENGRGIAGDLAAVASIAARLGLQSDAYDYWHRSFDAALAVGDPKVVRKSLQALISLAGELGKAEDKARYSALLAKLDAAEARQAAASGGASGAASGGTAAR